MLKAGTIITCPECKAEQLKSTKDILPGAQMRSGEWESLGFDMNSHNMSCYKCGHLWNRRHPRTNKGQIHTLEDAWISLEKEIPKSEDKPKSQLLL